VKLKIKTVNEQFLVEIAPSAAGDAPLAGMDPAAGLLELNRLFTAWVEQVYLGSADNGSSSTRKWALTCADMGVAAWWACH